MKKLFAIDMDGTCLTDRKKISKNTILALKKAADSGIIIVPTTGRSLDALPRQLLGESFYRYVITSNGARIYDVKEQKSVYSALLSQKTAINILMDAKKQGLGLTAHIENKNVVEGASLYLKGRLIYKKDATTAVRTKDIIRTVKQENCDVEEVQLFFFNERQKNITKKLVEKFEDTDYAFGRYYAEIYAKNSSKGVAIAKLAETLGIDKRDVVCIGNGENDLTMFDGAGLKLAVENADPALKAKADIVVPSNNKDGVAYATLNILLAN